MHVNKGLGTRITLMILMVLLIMIFLVACQPTPQKAAVVNKNQGVLEDRIASTGNPSNGVGYKAPEKWTEPTISENDGKLNFIFDAAVQLPDQGGFPVYEIGPMKTIDQSMVDSIIKGYFKDVELYNPVPLTQKQISDLIVEKKQELIIFENGESRKTPEEKKIITENMNAQIEMLESELPSAPETVDKVPLDLDVQKGSIRGVAFTGEDGLTNISISTANGSDRALCSVTFSGQNKYAARSLGLDAPKYELPQPDLNSTTEDQAIQRATELIEQMGFKGYVPDNASIVPDRDDNTSPQCTYAFCVSFKHDLDGIKITAPAAWQNPQEVSANGQATSGGSSVGVAASYSSFRALDERLNVYINDKGAVQFEWSQPYKVAEKLNENVELAPFEEIQDRIKQQLKETFIWQEEMDQTYQNFKLTKDNITIKNINLEYTFMPKKDDPDRELLVPVWNIYGHRQTLGVLKNENGKWTEQDSDTAPYAKEILQSEQTTPLITLNAIDGSMLYTN